MNTLANGLTAVALLVGGGYAFNLYKRYPVDSFCREISATDTSEDIVSRASSKGLYINPLDENKDNVWVFNQRAPWWRYACIVEFKDGKVSGKSVMVAD